MADLDARVYELGLQGLCCTQVMVTLALQDRGEENPQMVASVAGLCFGLSEGLLCGALSAGALVLGVLAGERVNGVVVSDLVDWFRDQYGTTQCADIIGGDLSVRRTVCPGIVAATYREVESLLDAYGALPRLG